ncbi:cysteine-rich DPF motif domain-containing protein 1 isoform X2 [Athalia rosae]|nr:cysteine-rich DPF motif domain-containing protein 1 isoform X2 [Athalia rosae]
MEPVATSSAESYETSDPQTSLREAETLRIKKDHGGEFRCSYCLLEEHYDYKGAKPPFAKNLAYLEDCYIMKDPFSQPNRGEVLVLGADCIVCNKPVCLGCSIFFAKRFCRDCAAKNIASLPMQLHAKIKSLRKENDQSDDKY